VVFTIVGVTPADFFGPDVGLSFGVVVPFGAESLIGGRNQQHDPRLRGGVAVMIRLKPGQSIDAASEVLRGVQPQPASAFTASRRTPSHAEGQRSASTSLSAPHLPA
jgi:hypothetical protein